MRVNQGKVDYTEKFTGRASEYSKYRPGYPRKIIAILEKEIGLNKRWDVADVGSGTGILSRPFVRYGNKVFGVEPNEEMRLSAEKSLGRRFSNFVSVSGRAEATSLPSHSVHLVLVGQALHWFDQDGAKREFARILMRNGYVSIVYNRRRQDGGVEMAYSDLIRRYARRGATVPEAGDAFVSRFFGAGLRGRFSVPNSQTLDLDGLLGRLASASYMPRRASRKWASIEEEAKRIIREYGRRGRVSLHYDTTIYLGRVVLNPVTTSKGGRSGAACRRTSDPPSRPP